MNEPTPVSLPEIRTIVTDASEVAKGTQILDKGGLAHLARHANKLFAEATGSGSAPYKPQIVFEEKGIRGRCSCMAARSRPFCKHAAALLLAWARDPAGFAVAAAPVAPPAGEGGAKKAAPKRSKVDTQAQLRAGVDQVLVLVRELAVAGVSALAAERVEQVRALAETLRAEGLRRISARTLELSAQLALAARNYAAFDPAEYAAILGDLLLAAKRVEKHLQGETLKPEHVEELIGKTWTKKDRLPVGDLDLVEYSFRHRVTPDDFVIRESRFLELGSGAHYSEKQILPAFLAKRTTPKASYLGQHLRGAGGGRYPGFAPIRLDLAEPGTSTPVEQAALAQLAGKLVPSVSAALALLQEQRKDPFAPDEVPVALACDTLCFDANRLFALDAAGQALALPVDRDTEQLLTSALQEAQLEGIFGEMLLDGALPSLVPLAVLVRRGAERALIPVSAGEPILRRNSRRTTVTGKEPPRRRWLDSARELGVSAGAVILGEIREELAEALAEGLGSLDRRRAEPLAARLGELSLAKPAALLLDLSQRPDPADRLEDTIKLHQVLGIGLGRLAGARAIDRAQLTASPLHPAFHVRAPETIWAPAELLAELQRSQLDRHQRAIVVGRSLSGCSAEDLLALAPVLWADGSVAPLVVPVYAAHPDLALEFARRTLDSGGQRYPNMYMRFPTASGRVAKMTALRVLGQLSDAAARTLLVGCGKTGLAALDAPISGRSLDPALRALARQVATGRTEIVAPELLDKLAAGHQADRIAALEKIGEKGALAALPLVRQLAATDPAREVRRAAAATQALLLDVDAVEAWIDDVRSQSVRDEEAGIGAQALGLLGDQRAIRWLVQAFERGWKPMIVAESLSATGLAVLQPLLDLIEKSPELATRAASLYTIHRLESADVMEAMLARLPDPLDEPGLDRLALYLKMAGEAPMKAELLAVLAARSAHFPADSPPAKKAAKILHPPEKKKRAPKT